MGQVPKPNQASRHYPAVYEKLIPVALGLIALGVLLAVAFALAVALRLVPGVTP